MNAKFHLLKKAALDPRTLSKAKHRILVRLRSRLQKDPQDFLNTLSRPGRETH